jgi:hypothetical protein
MLLFSTITFPQKTTYIGLEGALTHDVYEILHKGNGLKRIPIISGLWGVNIRQHISEQFFLQTGVIRKYYEEGIAFKKMDGYTGGDAMSAWFVPFSIGSSYKLLKNKIFISPVIGYVFCINSDYGYGNGGGGGIYENNDGTKITYQYISTYNLKNFSLLQTGLSLELTMFKTGILAVSGNYYTGFKKLIGQDIAYKINNEPGQTGSAYSRGDVFSLGIEIKYPVSKHWSKKTKRWQSR